MSTTTIPRPLMATTEMSQPLSVLRRHEAAAEQSRQAAPLPPAPQIATARTAPRPGSTYSDGSAFGVPGRGLEKFAASIRLPSAKPSPVPAAPAPSAKRPDFSIDASTRRIADSLQMPK